MPSFIDAIADSVLPGGLRERLNYASQLWPGEPRSAIDQFLAAENVPPPTIAVMTFVRSLLVYVEDDEYVCGGILAHLSAYSLESLAASLFDADLLGKQLAVPPDDFPENWSTVRLEKVKVEFFEAYPLIVLIYLLGANKFTLGDRQKLLVTFILNAMVNDELKIGSPELLAQVKKAFADLEDTELSAAFEFITSLKTLSSLVEDPLDVARLYSANYRSLRSITAQSKDSFKGQLMAAGTSETTALKIFDYAQGVDCWNEQLWLNLMYSRRADSIMIKPSSAAEIPTPVDETWMGQSHNNLTDIFRLEDLTCEECCSVTSLSAYFADLLSLLSNTTSTGQNIVATTSTGQNSVATNQPATQITLLNLLSQRRPDLRKLELTCANSQTLIPYISLVNEVLESYIRYKKGLPATDSVQAFNTPVDAKDDEHSLQPLNLPGNTDYEVYSQLISQQRFPFTCFPYDLARNIVTSYFDTFRVAHSEFVNVFQAPQRILQRTAAIAMTAEVKKSLTLGAEELLERQGAAETLNLHHMEFAAITGESFFPQPFIDLLEGLSTETVIDSGIPEYETCQLWGYENDDTMLGSDLGLTQIKSQLMLRSGLEFQDVLDLVNTQLFCQHLVITNVSGSDEFKESIAELRLLSSASSPPFKPLSSNICRVLQSFLRLKTKLGWSTKVLDAAIHCLKTRELESSPSYKSNEQTEVLPISVYTVKGIAAIVKLSDLCGVEPEQLLPLWGKIDSYGEESLLHRRFLRSSSGVFSVPQEGAYFQIGGTVVKIQAYGTSVCANLNWPFEYFQDLLQATDLTDTDLSIDTFSILFRYVLICRILNIPPKFCVSFFESFFGQEDPLVTPTATLAHITNWTSLLNSGWTIDTILLVIGRGTNSNGSGTKGTSGLQLTRAILDGSEALKKSLPSLFSGAIATSEDVIECAGRTFDSITAKMVVEFVEGSQVRAITVSFDTKQNLQKLIDLSKTWPQKLSVIPSSTSQKFSAQLKLCGILRSSEKEQIMNDTQTLPLLSTALESLVENSLLPQEIIEARFQTISGQLSSNILLQDWTPTLITTSSSSDNSIDDISIEYESQVQERRATFVQLAKPAIVQDTLTTSILSSMKDLVPDIDISVMSNLLTDTVKVPVTQNGELQSAMVALKQISVPAQITTDGEALDAYYTPTTTDDFKLHYTGTSEDAPNLMIDGIKVQYNTASKAWNTFRMVTGQSYLLQGTFPSSQISWSTCRSMTTPFDIEDLLSAATIQRANIVLDAIRRAVTLCQIMQLTVSELLYINRQAKTGDDILAMNLNSMSLRDVVHLRDYCQLREDFKDVVTDSDLISLFSWLNSTANELDIGEIATKIAASTTWQAELIENILISKYPGLPATDIVLALRQHDAFMDLRAIFVLYARLGNESDISSKPLMEELFYLARPPLQLNSGDSYMEAGKKLRDRLTPSQRETADEGLMESQRTALIGYLLQQAFITDDLGIWDADGLFEHFLIDVQMGPQIRTSRIKQGISVVQLFIQRCLLGMETGVPKSVLGQEKWDWMSQYTLWESHRKLFLYTENWIDPALRDDKSQLFDKFEATLMQKDLSMKTFFHATQNYVYDLDGISSLDIVAYAHEPHPDASDIFHLFGRTRSSPYSFWYRTLTKLRTSEIFWQPWIKVDMDISSIETEWEGQRLVDTGSYLLPIMINGRLYLFMPAIVPKTLVKTASSLETPIPTFEDLRTQPPNIADPTRNWEITMAWTEFVNETWAPKRVSSGSLSAGLAASSSQFRVDPTLQDNILTLDVSFGQIGQKSSTSVGSFVFCNDQLSITSKSGSSTHESPFPTFFQKALREGMDLLSLPTGLNYDPNTSPLLWVPPMFDELKAEEVSWTLSKLPQRVTGLVVSGKISEGRRASYFNIPKLELLTSEWDQNTITNNTELVLFDHIFSHELMEATADRVDPLRSLYTKIAQLPTGDMRESFGAGSLEAWYHELGRPTAIYNWEIGLHTVLLAVDRFNATQQYDNALEVAKLVFDPSVDLELDADNNKTYQSCWRFPPFQEMARKIARQGEDSFDPLNLDDLSKEIQLAIKERRSYGSLVHAAARGRPVSYMKWIVMKYAEILIAMGDIFFRRASLEDLPIATQRYIEAARVLGSEPPKVPDLGKRKKKAMTFEQLREQHISHDSVMFDLGLPFSAQLESKGAAVEGDSDPKGQNLACFLRTNYFCTPLNPKFKEMRSLVHERLFNLRNSFDITGKPVIYGLREPPIDPGALMALSKQGLGVSDVLSLVSGERDSPLPRQRFDTLLRKALALCSEVRELSQRLVFVIEKKELETFNIGGAQHNIVIQNMMLDIQGLELQEAQQTVDSLSISRKALESQLDYYLKLIGESESLIPKSDDDWVDIQQSIDAPTTDELRMSSYENSEMNSSNNAAANNQRAIITDAIAIPLYAIPQASADFQPLGVGGSLACAGTAIAEAIAGGSTLARGYAAICADEAARADKKASLTAQLRDRRLQANMTGREIKSIDKQIDIQNTCIKSIEKQIEMQKSQVEDAAGTEAWYRSQKYTSEQLYTWMEKALRNVYSQGYELAMTMALRAQSSLVFEGGRDTSIVQRAGYWNPGQDGLLAADSLYLDLRRLEGAQLDGPTVDYNITKTVSLKDVDPLALMKLRITGTTDFSVGELLYDMDFPGHYMRRIRSVSVSIPSNTEGKGNTNAVLTLLEHKYRVTQNAADYAVSQSDAGSEAFRTDRIPITSIAVSSGAKDCGVFELNFSGPRYMPFEGAGAISTWRLEFPSPIRHFDFETITDVQLHVQYTAYEGGPTLKKAAKDAVVKASQTIQDQGQNQGYWAFWDLKNDFAGIWAAFKTHLVDGTSGTLELGDLKELLPFWSRQQNSLQVQSFTLISRSKNVMGRLSISMIPYSPATTPDPDCPLTDGDFYGLFTRTPDFSNMKISDNALKVDTLKWNINASAKEEGGTAESENVYLAIRYIYGK